MAPVKKFALLTGLAAVSSLSLVAAPAGAQEVENVPEINNGAISFSLGADVVSKYIFRGYEQAGQEEGVIVQPYAEFAAAVADGVDVYAGTWSNINSETSGDSGTNQHFYETDYYAGVSLGEDLHGLPGFAFDISYVNYVYPSGAATDYEEIDLKASYDDSANNIAFSPYALVAFEFDTQGADENNIYAELGGEVAFEVVESDEYPVALTVPVAIGLSLDEFYVNDEGDNEFFGYLSVGANVGVPLAFIPREYGQWSAAAGITLFLLNDNAEGLDDGDNENFNIAGSLGFALEY